MGKIGHKTEIRVIYADTDAMSVVYHSNYFKWFEVGRTELLRSIGFPYSRLEQEGVRLPVIECGCKVHQTGGIRRPLGDNYGYQGSKSR